MSDSELSIHVYMRQRTVFSGVFVVGEEVKGEKDDGEEREGQCSSTDIHTGLEWLFLSPETPLMMTD